MTAPLVSIAQMQAIEQRMFAAGMPIAALMEKVGGLICQRFLQLFPCNSYPRVGVVFGNGHNGGDALVVARELWGYGYQVMIFTPSDRLKDLTAQHHQYLTHLGIVTVDQVADLHGCDVLIDGLFGFGLNRALSAELVAIIDSINLLHLPIVSIDLPSGIHADSGMVLGAAIRASHTLCLGLWKLAFAEDRALVYMGAAELLGFGIPPADIQAVLGLSSPVQMMDRETAHHHLPQQRPLVTHKYQQGHLLLVVGSEQYPGAAILAGLAVRASGVGLLSIAVPQSIKLAVLHHLPDAIVIGCPETATGAIADLPALNWSKFTAIACGCGLTSEPRELIKFLLNQSLPLVLDADALNILAEMPPGQLHTRAATTILTPHGGEWHRLFPAIDDLFQESRIAATVQAAQQAKAIVVRKGARTIISNGEKTWVINNGTPALARGGSGDVLTGLMGGLVAQPNSEAAIDIVASANWWHAQAGWLAAQARGIGGVDAVTLTSYLTAAISRSTGLVD